MKSFIILIAICVLTWECTAQTDSISSHDYFRLYQLASGKLSSNYVVVNVTDMKTLRAKEISIEYKYLDRAIEMDHGETIIDEPNRIFKFFSDEALEYIDFFTFDSLKMIKCLENLSAEILLNNWKRNDIEFSNNYNMSRFDVTYKLNLQVMFVSNHNAANLTKIENLQKEFDFTVEHITRPFTDAEFIKVIYPYNSLPIWKIASPL